MGAPLSGMGNEKYMLAINNKLNRIMMAWIPRSWLMMTMLACGGGSPPPDKVFPPYDFFYDLTEPDTTFVMPGVLTEISGLGITPDRRHLLAVQDEDGIIFLINRQTGKVDGEIDFWKDGDYEGIEAVGEAIWVVKSSGTLYRVVYDGKEHSELEKFNQLLGQKNDVEGLAYDAVSHRLLLACKGRAGDGEEYTFKKGIYAFDLESQQMDSIPTYLISLEDVQAYLQTSPNIRKLEKLMDYFSLDKSEFVFSPSALAIHPHTGELYILSSVGKLLLILSPGNEILHIEKLRKEVHGQPEGIAFDADGTMYIANEGTGSKGVIHRFRYREE